MWGRAVGVLKVQPLVKVVTLFLQFWQQRRWLFSQVLFILPYFKLSLLNHGTAMSLHFMMFHSLPIMASSFLCGLWFVVFLFFFYTKDHPFPTIDCWGLDCYFLAFCTNSFFFLYFFSLVQRVWRRYYVMKKVAEKIREEWKALAYQPNYKDRRWISANLIRPFLFFTTQPSTLHQTLQSTNVECMLTCFKLILQSINSAGRRSYSYFSISMQKICCILCYQIFC